MEKPILCTDCEKYPRAPGRNKPSYYDDICARCCAIQEANRNPGMNRTDDMLTALAWAILDVLNMPKTQEEIDDCISNNTDDRPPIPPTPVSNDLRQKLKDVYGMLVDKVIL